jgi:hypothetical protein
MTQQADTPGQPGPRQRKLTTNHLNGMNRAKLAIQLRTQRVSYDEIAVRVGYSDGAVARHAIQRELNNSIQSDIDLLREEEAASLDALEAVCWERLQDAKFAKSMLFAVDRIIAIKERRARMFGYDAQQQTLSGPQIIIEEAPAGYLGIVVDSSSASSDSAIDSDSVYSSSIGVPPHRVGEYVHVARLPSQIQPGFFGMPEIPDKPDYPEMVIDNDYFGIDPDDFNGFDPRGDPKFFSRSGSLVPVNPENEHKPVKVVRAAPTGGIKYEGVQRYEKSGRLKRTRRFVNTQPTAQDLVGTYEPISDPQFLGQYNKLIPEHEVRKGPYVRSNAKGRPRGSKGRPKPSAPESTTQ